MCTSKIYTGASADENLGMEVDKLVLAIDYRCDDEKKKTLELGRHFGIIA
jgi:hypothetical protein